MSTQSELDRPALELWLCRDCGAIARKTGWRMVSIVSKEGNCADCDCRTMLRAYEDKEDSK